MKTLTTPKPTLLESSSVLSWCHCGDKISRLYVWPQGEGVLLLRRPHSRETQNTPATAYISSKSIWLDCLKTLPKIETDRLIKQYAAHSHHIRECGLNLASSPVQGRPIMGSLIMGIVNVTPDSFYDGGQHSNTTDAIAYGTRLVSEGAQILDIGGESTRPGAEPPSLDEELGRTLPVIQGILQQDIGGFSISIDTRRAAVMQTAVQAGAQIINDVSALEDDPASLTVAAQLAREHGTIICLMHKQGQPQTMQNNPRYTVASLDVYDHLESRLQTCLNTGIPKDKIWLDPGIGFGKTLAHNLDILSHLGLYHGLGCPLLVGLSRKGFVSHIMEKCGKPISTSQARLPGSLAGAIHCMAHGVQIVRVHDVAETLQALAVTHAIQKVI